MYDVTIETLQTTKGFFDTYNTVKHDHFIALFGAEVTTDDISALDNLLIDTQGDRFLLKRYADMFIKSGAIATQNRLVENCDRLFFDSWKATKDSIIKALTSDVSRPLGYSRHVETTRDNDNLNKVYSFDSATPANDNASETDEIVTTNETIEKDNGKTTSENAKKLIDFTRNNDFLDIILSDIAQNIALSIF